MKREDVKNKIPGITEEQLNWLMQENGSDITREKSAAAALQTQLNSAQAQLKTAQDGLKAFDGVDVAGAAGAGDQTAGGYAGAGRWLCLRQRPEHRHHSARRAAAWMRCALCWIWMP